MTTVSKLPAAQQERRERMLQEQNNNEPPATPEPQTPANPQAPKPPEQQPNAQPPKAPEPQTPAPSEPAQQSPNQPTKQVDTPVDTVSLSRDEVNQLRADAEQTKSIRQRLEMLELELAEARQGLTSPPPASKGEGVAPAPGAAPSASSTPLLAFDAAEVELTEEEQKEYGESEPIIAKVAKREVAKAVNNALGHVQARLDALEHNLKSTSTRVQQRESRGFIDSVRQKVARFDTIVHHQHWPAFLDSSVPDSAFTYREQLAKGHEKQNLNAVASVLTAFEKKYLPDANASDAYSAPNVQSVQAPPAPSQQKEMLKMSVRRKASDDYIKGRITKEELDKVVAEFKQAEQEGRIDYSN